MIHLLLALATAAIAGLIVGVAGFGAVGGRTGLVWVDRLILGALGAVALAIAAGIGLLVTGNAPADTLHLVYAGAALVALPVARFAAPSLNRRRRLVAVAIGALALIALTVRLLQTG